MGAKQPETDSTRPGQPGLDPAPDNSGARDRGSLEPIVWHDWEQFIPPRELWAGPKDALVQFFRWPWEYRAYLPLLCGVHAHSSVLELGCSHGRTMLPLLEYLKPPGRYEGLDIMPRQIEFAQRAIQSGFPHCRFTLADVHNLYYNPEGKLSSETYEFPYEDAAFDTVYAASVFTHMLPPSARNYLKQSRRVLRSDGNCLFSFFLLDHYGGAGTTWCNFEHEVPGHDGIAVHDPANPEHVVAYRIDLVRELAREAGLAIKRILPGHWSKTQEFSVNEQDLVLFEPV